MTTGFSSFSGVVLEVTGASDAARSFFFFCFRIRVPMYINGNSLNREVSGASAGVDEKESWTCKSVPINVEKIDLGRDI